MYEPSLCCSNDFQLIASRLLKNEAVGDERNARQHRFTLEICKSLIIEDSRAVFIVKITVTYFPTYSSVAWQIFYLQRLHF